MAIAVAAQRYERLAAVGATLRSLPSIRHVVVVPYLSPTSGIHALPNAIDFAALGTPCGQIDFAPMPFNHPIYISYAAAPGGVPRWIMHGAGGTLLQHQTEQVLHTNLKRTDRLFCITSCGDMMWNWLASALATGAALVLYEGSAFHPDPGVLWRLAEQERVTVFGISAQYLAALDRSGFQPRASVDLSPLQTILSTDAPLAPQQFDFVYQAVKEDVQLASMAAGEDVLSCIGLGNPVLPVYRGEIQSRALGMRVEVFDQSGRSIRGERGELVCCAPFPAMPIGLWNDPDGARFRVANFGRGTAPYAARGTLTEHDGIAMSVAVE